MQIELKHTRKEEKSLAGTNFHTFFPSWRNDAELLDRIVELCNVAIKAEPSRELTVDELYLRALEAKYKCLALIKSKDVLSIIDMSNKCFEDFDGAISHYKELVEKEQQC